MKIQGFKRTFLRTYKLALFSLFSFLLGCMFTSNIIPINKTCQLDNVDREYNIMQNSKLKNPELIILILSAPKNFNKRNVLRHSWLKLKTIGQENFRDSKKFKVKHFFAVGSENLKENDLKLLKEEQSEFSDILLLPVLDTYDNLTVKLVKSFEWLNEQYIYGLGFKYVLKCDDDTFVRIDSLIHEIQHIELLFLKSQLSNAVAMTNDYTSPYIRTNIQVGSEEISNNLSLYWGYFDGRASVKKKGKWKENNWIACDKYVPYALGGGYILSKKLITYIANNAAYLRKYNSEDVSVGFWLSTLTDILRIHDIRFDTEWTSRGCQNFFLVSHNLDEKKMNEMASNVVLNRVLCTKEHVVRNFYHYNWTALPSQCCKIVKF